MYYKKVLTGSNSTDAGFFSRSFRPSGLQMARVFCSYNNMLLGASLVPMWYQHGSSAPSWALLGALGARFGLSWPLLGLSGGARGAFMGPFLGHTCPHLVAMLNKVAPKRNACAHPAKSSARSKNTLSVHLLLKMLCGRPPPPP